MLAAADGALTARRLSGSMAGSSAPAPVPTNHHALVRPPPRQSRRRLRQQITRLLSGAAAVPSNVRVVTKDSVRVKRILAEVQVRASVEQVWRVLTDYNRLAYFVPNLDHCERMAGAPPGKQRLRQRACSQSLYWRLQAEAVLDVQEVYRSLGRRELHFTMVEGDFQEFSGRWILDPDPSVQDGISRATVLRYEVSIVPKWSLPSTIITTIVRCGLPANVRAIATQAEQIAQRRLMAPKFAKAVLEDKVLPEPWANVQRSSAQQEEVLPAKGPARTTGVPVLQDSPLANLDAKGRVLKNEKGRDYLGLMSVPLPFPVPKQAKSRGWERVLPSTDALTAQQRQTDKDMVQASYPSFIAGEARGAGHEGLVEVHLRRLDDPLMLHRRAVASVIIEAAVEEVWEVLTDYERLPEFLPNLALSERLPTPPGAPDRLVRLRQVGYKSMMYMHLHAEATLALVENPCKEIQFRQLDGDFQLLQGKFMLQDAIQPEAKQWNKKARTVLKYAVEVEIPRSTAMLGLLEPVLERVVYQDIPSNLTAIKDRVHQQRVISMLANEEAEGKGDSMRAKALRNRVQGRLTATEMAADFSLLEAELRSTFGEDGPLPSRSALRNLKRFDIEDAVRGHGGPLEVSKRLGWKTTEKAKTLWSSLDSIQAAFEDFAAKEGLPRRTLPSEQMLLRAKRKDLLNGAQQWGGLATLASLLEYEVANEEFVSDLDLQLQMSADSELEALLSKRRPRRGQMIADFGLLAKELKRCFGEEGPLPSSTEMRSMKRHDLAGAIAHHGGTAEVSKRMGWSQHFRPPNYWSDLENCRAELDSFCEAEGLPQGTLPSVYVLQQAKRYDLQRAVRHWGGTSNFASVLGYRLTGGSATALNGSTATEREEGRTSDPGNNRKVPEQRPAKPARRTTKDLREEIDSW